MQITQVVITTIPSSRNGKIENEFKYPSPAQSLRDLATSPTRGEVILTGAKTSPLWESYFTNRPSPLPLWERVTFRKAKGQVRGLKKSQLTSIFNI